MNKENNSELDDKEELDFINKLHNDTVDEIIKIIEEHNNKLKEYTDG